MMRVTFDHTWSRPVCRMRIFWRKALAALCAFLIAALSVSVSAQTGALSGESPKAETAQEEPGSAPGSASPPWTEPEDSQTVREVQAVYTYLSGAQAIPLEQQAAADVVPDGAITAEDALILFEAACGRMQRPQESLPRVYSAQIENRTGGGYDWVLTLAGNVAAVSRAQFPTWTVAGGQDDIFPAWQTNPKASGVITGRQVRYRVLRSDHGGKEGEYQTDCYLYGANGQVLLTRPLSAVTFPKMLGVDVSDYQPNLDWEALKAGGVQFAILKCGFGQDYADKSQDDKWFEYNVSECERLGIPWGAYLFCYARNAQEAQGEAQHTIRLLKGKHPDLPVYLDLEPSTYQGDLSPKTYAAIAETYCGLIAEAGYRPGIYGNAYYWNHVLTEPCFTSSGWSRWVAHYADACGYEGEYDIWQFSDRARLPGFDGNIDANYAYIRLWE